MFKEGIAICTTDVCKTHFHATYENILGLFLYHHFETEDYFGYYNILKWTSAFSTTEHCIPHHVINSEFQPSLQNFIKNKMARYNISTSRVSQDAYKPAILEEQANVPTRRRIDVW